MNELIEKIVASTGVDQDLAAKAVSIILGFLNKEGPEEPMQRIMAAIPGSDELIGGANGGGGMLGGLMGSMGAMGVLNDLNSAGLDMGQVQSVTTELVDYAKEKAGADTVDEVIGAIPGLSQFI